MRSTPRQSGADHLEHEFRREVKSHQCITARPVNLHDDVLPNCQAVVVRERVPDALSVQHSPLYRKACDRSVITFLATGKGEEHGSVESTSAPWTATTHASDRVA